MARVDLIQCDNCAAEFSASPEARASMTQLVITQGGSRSHVYDLCPTCAGGLTQTLPDDPAEWPRFVSREAVQQWLRSRPALTELEPLTKGNPWDDPARREAAKEKERREARGDFGHVRRPTEYGDGLETEKES